MSKKDILRQRLAEQDDKKNSDRVESLISLYTQLNVYVCAHSMWKHKDDINKAFKYRLSLSHSQKNKITHSAKLS